VTCRLEWDVLAGLTHFPMPVYAAPRRVGGVAGEAAGGAAEVVGSAGAGLHPTVTPGGKTVNEILLEEVKNAKRIW
jgi:hypothetical protein